MHNETALVCDCCFSAIDPSCEVCPTCALALTLPVEAEPLSIGESHDRIRWARSCYLRGLSVQELTMYADRLLAEREAFIVVYGANPRKG